MQAAQNQMIQAPQKERAGTSARLNAPSSELQELKDRYLSWMIGTGYAEDTIKGAHSDLEWFFKFLRGAGVLRVADVTTETLNDYSLWIRENKNSRHEGRSLSLHHIAHRLIGVKLFFRWLAQQMAILYDPAEDLELPRIHRGLPQTILTQDEARRLLDAPDMKSPVGYREKAMLELLYATGLRTKELLKLKVEDLDLKSQAVLIRQGKGRKDRLIPIPPLTAGYLKEYVEKVRPRFAKGTWNKAPDQGFLFLSFAGGRFTPGRLKDVFDRALKAAKLDKRVTAMTLRHSIASHLLENGMDIRFIQEFLGHEKLSTTQIYTRVTLSGLRKSYNKAHPKERRAKGRNQILDETL